MYKEKRARLAEDGPWKEEEGEEKAGCLDTKEKEEMNCVSAVRRRRKESWKQGKFEVKRTGSKHCRMAC